MRIYVDFDDCLCETGRAFSKLALEMFNKHVPYDQIHYFELDRSFGLDAEQYEQLMLRGHEPEILYISAHSSKESQAAYRALGCSFAEEINEELAAVEPFDVQMEYRL